MNGPADNLFWQETKVTPGMREALLGQKGCVLWFTGLSGSGKSTIAGALERALIDRGHLSYLLDGDNIRHGLNAGLGFSDEDRVENLRRISEVARLFADSGVISITAFISPLRSSRERARTTVGVDRFIEVFVSTSLAVCEQRDTKGLYKKARAGEVSDFTGISSPFEPPEHADITLNTEELSVEGSVDTVLAVLRHRGFVLQDGISTPRPGE